MSRMIRKSWLFLIVLIVCKNDDTKDYPKDTRNYVTVSKFEWDNYLNTGSSGNLQRYSFNGSNILKLSNVNTSGYKKYANFNMYLNPNNLPVDTFKTDSTTPSCTSGTRYTNVPIAPLKLFKDGVTSRTYGKDTYAIYAGYSVLSAGLTLDDDIIAGNYTLRFYDGDEVEFFSAPLVVAP